AVEVHELSKRSLAAVHEVRSGQLDVAKSRSFERAADRNRSAGGNCRAADQTLGSEFGHGERGDPGGIAGSYAEIVSGGPDADVVESDIVPLAVFKLLNHAAAGDVGNSSISK